MGGHVFDAFTVEPDFARPARRLSRYSAPVMGRVAVGSAAAVTASVASVGIDDLPFVTYRSKQERDACFLIVIMSAVRIQAISRSTRCPSESWSEPVGAMFPAEMPYPRRELPGSVPLHLCQRSFRLRQPERHLHGSVQFDGCRQFGTGLLPLAGFDVEGAETQVTMGLQRAHAEFVGQGKGLLVMSCRLLDVQGIATPGDLAEETEGVRLVATSYMGARRPR